MERHIILTLLLMLFATASAQAKVPWAPLNGSTSSGGHVFIHIDDFAQGPGQHDVWVKTDLSSDKTTAFRYSMVLDRIDCANRKIGVVQSVFYYPDGRTEATGPFDHPQMSMVVPDSVGEAVLEAVCESPQPA